MDDALDDVVIEVGGGSDSVATVDLKTHFDLDVEVTRPIAQFDTSEGKINIELLNDSAPLTVTNFLGYVGREDYDGSFFHRLFLSTTLNIIQGGGFTLAEDLAPVTIASNPTDGVVNEYSSVNANARGTISMAKLGGDPDSATNQWFFNTGDNSETLNENNNGGFAVFGRVMGTGLDVVDALANYDVWSLDQGVDDLYSRVPLKDYVNGTDFSRSHFAVVESVREIGIYPGDNANGSVLEFSATSSNESIARAMIVDSELQVVADGAAVGQAIITVTATDSNGNAVDDEFLVTINSTIAAPYGRTIAAGESTTLNASAQGVGPFTYEWFKDGVAIADSNSSALDVTEAGVYTVSIGNASGSTLSAGATVAVVANVGQLVNVSTRGHAGIGASKMVAGVTVEGTDSKSLLFRADRVSLVADSLTGVLADPTISVDDVATEVAANDDWDDASAEAGMTALFTRLGATAFVAGSTDSAVVYDFMDGARTFEVEGVGSTEGLVLAEVYDADEDISATDTRITSMSTRLNVKADDGIVIGGFVIVGDGPVNVLIRGGSQALEADSDLVAAGILADPNLTLYSGSTVLAENEDWDDDASSVSLKVLQEDVGATPFAVGSGDALLYMTLEPGIYTVRMAGGEGLATIDLYVVK